jgi:thermitase
LIEHVRMSILRLAPLLFLACIAITPPAAAAAGRGRAPQWVAGELIVGMKPGVTASSLGPAALAGGHIVAAVPHTEVRLLRVPVDGVATAAAALAADPRVAFVERNRLLPPAEVPNDPVISYHTALIGLPEAWDTSHGNPNLVIAILDSGIDPDHLDLAAKLVPGFNFWDNNDDTRDVFGHGTEVAGVAAAITDNGTDVAGVAWECGLMPVRVTNTDGFASLFAIAQALAWAVDNGAKVINLSFAGIHSSPALDTGLAYVRSQGGLTVAAAGNGGGLDSSPDHSDVVSVAATTASDVRASWSSYGPYVDLAAPGASLRATKNGGGAVGVSGTSFSSPVVAGVAALVWSVDPSLTPAEVESLLEATAIDLGAAGRDDPYGAGRVDAAAAVTAALSGAGPPPDDTPPAVELLSPTEGEVVAGQITVEASASDGSGIARVEFYVDGVLAATDPATPYQYLWDTEQTANGDHTLSVAAADTAGNTATVGPISVTVDNPVAPVLTALSVANAQPKTQITLVGSGFDLATVHVTIGDKYAPVVALAPDAITVKVPRLPKYTVVPVAAANGSASSAPLSLEIR